MELFPDFVAQEPTLEETLLLGKSLLQAKKLEEALSEFKEARRQAPEMTNIHMVIGQIYSRQSKYSHAEESFRRATSLDPLSPQPLLALGKLYLRKGQLGKAEEEFRSVLVVMPNSELALVGLGNIALKQGQLDVAEQHLKSALATTPELVEARLNLSEVYKKRKLWESAISILNEAPQTIETAPVIKFKLAEILLDSQRYRGALQVLENSRSDYPLLFSNSGPAQLNLAEAYLGANNPAEADKQLDEIVDYRLLAQRQQRLKGFCYARMGDDQRAIAAFREAWSIEQQRLENDLLVEKRSACAAAVELLQFSMKQQQMPLRITPVMQIEKRQVAGWLVTLQLSEEQLVKSEIGGWSIPLGWWLIIAACKHLNSAECCDNFVLITLSPRQFEDPYLGDHLGLASSIYDIPISAVFPLVEFEHSEEILERWENTLENLSSVDIQIAVSSGFLDQSMPNVCTRMKAKYLCVPSEHILDSQLSKASILEQRDTGQEIVAHGILSAKHISSLQDLGIIYGMGPYFEPISST